MRLSTQRQLRYECQGATLSLQVTVALLHMGNGDTTEQNRKKGNTQEADPFTISDQCLPMMMPRVDTDAQSRATAAISDYGRMVKVVRSDFDFIRAMYIAGERDRIGGDLEPSLATLCKTLINATNVLQGKMSSIRMGEIAGLLPNNGTDNADRAQVETETRSNLKGNKVNTQLDAFDEVLSLATSWVAGATGLPQSVWIDEHDVANFTEFRTLISKLSAVRSRLETSCPVS